MSVCVCKFSSVNVRYIIFVTIEFKKNTHFPWRVFFRLSIDVWIVNGLTRFEICSRRWYVGHWQKYRIAVSRRIHHNFLLLLSRNMFAGTQKLWMWIMDSIRCIGIPFIAFNLTWKLSTWTVYFFSSSLLLAWCVYICMRCLLPPPLLLCISLVCRWKWHSIKLIDDVEFAMHQFEFEKRNQHQHGPMESNSVQNFFLCRFISLYLAHSALSCHDLNGGLKMYAKMEKLSYTTRIKCHSYFLSLPAPCAHVYGMCIDITWQWWKNWMVFVHRLRCKYTFCKMIYKIINNKIYKNM